MSTCRQYWLLAMLWSLNVSYCSADEFSLESLRFFYTPEQRNPASLAAAEVNPPQFVVRELAAEPRFGRMPVRYIGEIRSKTKLRFFWRQGNKRYLSTVPKKEVKRHNYGSAKSQGSSSSPKHAG